MPEARRRIAVVSRELYPFGGGGMGNYVNWTAEALADVAEVTVVTTAAHEAEYRALREAGDPRLDPRLRFVFAPDFDYDDHGTYYGYFHRWSAHVLEALRRAYPDRGPRPDRVRRLPRRGRGDAAGPPHRRPALSRHRASRSASTRARRWC